MRKPINKMFKGQPAPRVANPYQRPTAQAKAVQVLDKLGVPGAALQQGSTVEVYDYVLFTTTTAPTRIAFFKALNNKAYPYTNLQQNQLTTAESLIFDRVFISMWTVTSATNYNPNATTVNYTPAVLLAGFQMAQLNISVGNNTQVKDVSLARSVSNFQQGGATSINNVFELENPLVLPPQIQFYVELNVPAISSPAGEGQQSYLGVHLTGPGGVLNLQANI